MTPRHSFCLRKGVWSPQYVGCIGEDELKVEEEDDDEEPDARCINGGLSSVQLLGSHAKGKPCKQKVRVHNLHIQLFTVYMNL